MNMYAKTAVTAPPPEARGVEPEIILDLSRLLSRVLHPTPTGIDRVEMAYAQELLRRVPERLHFAAVHQVAGYGRLPRDQVLRFLEETERLWAGLESHDKARLRLAAVRKLWALRPRPVPKVDASVPRVYLQASPNNLHKPDLIERILRREQARFVCLVHDLIPIQFPEYARPTGKDVHCRRIDTVGRHADAVIAYSKATAEALTNYLGEGAVPPINIAPLGAHTQPIEAASQFKEEPYFLFVGTIEPRKNHLLLLNVWRQMVNKSKGRGRRPPKLVLVGRRGWENENVVDMLDRCPSLKEHVIEASRLSDPDAQELLRQSCALVMPSFVEGYGLPIAEALEIGVPVLCSDIPAHREVGGNVPEYLDPLDGPGWLKAIEDYAAPNSICRQSQIRRMSGWHRPTWEAHIKIVIETCNFVADGLPSVTVKA